MGGFGCEVHSYFFPQFNITSFDIRPVHQQFFAVRADLRHRGRFLASFLDSRGPHHNFVKQFIIQPPPQYRIVGTAAGGGIVRDIYDGIFRDFIPFVKRNKTGSIINVIIVIALQETAVQFYLFGLHHDTRFNKIRFNRGLILNFKGTVARGNRRNVVQSQIIRHTAG